MTRLLLLAEHPLRDLLSRALLRRSALAWGRGVTLLLATAAPRTPPDIAAVPWDADPAALGLDQMVIAGAFLDRAALEAALAFAGRGLAAGIPLAVQALSLEGEASAATPPQGVEVLEAAAPLRVRDHRTANMLTLWRLAAAITLDPYPERAIGADDALAAALPAGPLLGLAIRGGAEMRRSWMARQSALRALLAPAEGWPVVPLPSLPPGLPGDDMAGTVAFAAALLPEAPLLLPRMAEPAWWHREASPRRLRGLVARCRLVVTNRDMPAALAVAAGVPVIGLALGADRRIVSCLATLANQLPPGSDLVHPRPGP